MPEQFKLYTQEEALKEAELMKQKMAENEKLSYADAEKMLELENDNRLKKKAYELINKSTVLKSIIADSIKAHEIKSRTIEVDARRQPELPKNLSNGIDIIKYLKNNNLFDECFDYEDLLAIKQANNASNIVEAYGNGIIGWKGFSSNSIPFLIRYGNDVKLLWRNINEDFSAAAMQGVAMAEFADKLKFGPHWNPSTNKEQK